MPSSDAERLAILEEQVRRLRQDVEQNTREVERSRQRLHSLEATVRALVVTEQEERRIALDRQTRLTVRIQFAAAVVAAAVFVEPLVTHLVAK